MQEMIFQKGINWNHYDFRLKRGAVIGKVPIELTSGDVTYTRNKWRVIETPTFTQDREFIKGLLKIERNDN
jgi:hypothetical protein